MSYETEKWGVLILAVLWVLALIVVGSIIMNGRFPFENTDPNKKGWFGKKF